MTNLFFGEYAYENPIFTAKASCEQELPEAFDQIEKLRRSGFLAGFMRYDVLNPAKAPSARKAPVPCVHFTLYRRRRPLDPAPDRPRAFCPALGTLPDRESLSKAFCKAKEQGLDLSISCECTLKTVADSKDVYEHERRHASVAPAFFRDAFEEVVLFPKRLLFKITKECRGADEILHLEAPQVEDRQFVRSIAAPLLKEEMAEDGGELKGALKPGTTVLQIVSALLPHVEARGRDGDKDTLRAYEGRDRGIFGGLFGLFNAEETLVYSADAAMERRPGESDFAFAASQRTSRFETAEAFCDAIEADVRSFILPEGFCLCEPVRVENGKAFMLEAHLHRLLLAAKERLVPCSALEAVLEEAKALPKETKEAPFAPGLPFLTGCELFWQNLPEGMRKLLGPMPEGPCVLALSLDQKGDLSASVSPLPKASDAPLSFSRSSLDERNDFLRLPAAPSVCHAKAMAQMQKEGAPGILLVNRLGFVACAYPSFLVTEEGDGAFSTPPLSDGAMDDALRSELVGLGLLKEKRLSMAELFTAKAHYVASSVFGARAVRIERPTRRR